MQEINLYDLIKFYAKNWSLIISLTLIGLTLGIVYSVYIQKPLYKSEATLLILQPGTSTNSNDASLSNYLELFKSRRVIEPVMADMQISDDYDIFIKSVEASNSKNTAIMKISISGASADFSKTAADKSIASFQSQVKNIYESSNVKVVDGASQPTNPYNVNTLTQTAVTAIAGFIIAVIYLFFVYDYRQNNKNTPKKPTGSKKSKNVTLKVKSDKKESKKSKVESKELAAQDTKKTKEQNKLAAKKNRDAQILAKKAAKELKRQEKIKAKKIALDLKKSAKIAASKKRQSDRAIKSVARKQSIENIFAPLKNRIQQASMTKKFKNEIRQAELLARHEERMAKIEITKAENIEKRANAIARSKNIESQIATKESEDIMAIKPIIEKELKAITNAAAKIKDSNINTHESFVSKKSMLNPIERNTLR